MPHTPQRNEPEQRRSSRDNSHPVAGVRGRRKRNEMVGEYILGKTLGVGTTGKVKSAVHIVTAQTVAVKIVKKQYVRTHKEKIKREIAVMRLIDHPNVLKLFDVLETTHHIFLVMEYVKGGELFDYIISKGRLQRDEALRIMGQILQGVEYCHMHSVCHRDLKPENLLLDERKNIKIADFGMAQVSGPSAILNTFCGSPHYGSPEVVSGKPYDGRKSDVWSLGVVFYALITGMLPFDNPNISELLLLVKKGKYRIPSFVDSDIRDLIARMLVVDPERRIRTSEIRHHPCFKPPKGAGPYVPPQKASPALELMKSNPIRERSQIDTTIVRDLEDLGWGTQEQIVSRLLGGGKRSDMNNIEHVFYHLLQARNQEREQRKKRVERLKGTSDMPEKMRQLSIEITPQRSGSSSTAHSPLVQEVPSPLRTPSPTPVHSDSEGGARKVGKKGRPPHLSLTEDEPEHCVPLSPEPEFTTTPRFHRHRLKPSQQQQDAESRAPTTPSQKRSWFNNLFRRRPSLDPAGTNSGRSANGLYSPEDPLEVRFKVQKLLGRLGVSYRASAKSNDELKCEAFTFVDSSFNLVVTDRNGAVMFWKPSEEEKKQDPQGKSKQIQFSVQIGFQKNTRITSVLFMRMSGDTILWRELQHEIIKQLGRQLKKCSA